MTTANPDDVTARPGRPARPRRRLLARIQMPWLAALREALARPLAPYYLLLGATALLLTIGLIMVMSASSVYSYQYYNGDSYAVVKKQLIWVVLGMPCAWAASRMSLRRIRQLAWPAYVFSLLLLLMVVFFGQTVNGNKNWLALGPIRLQPSEIAKLAVVIWAAHIFALKERRLDRLSHVIVPVIPGMLLATAFVLAGDDLGTALVFFALMLGLLWVVGAPAKLFGFMVSVIAVGVIFLVGTDKERLARITSFTKPFQDLSGTGWQVGHGMYALSTGGWFGQGIGASQQKWGGLPEAHTDFIFAVLGEELGLVGTLLIIGLFVVLAYAAIRVACHTEEPFVRYVSFGVVVWLVGQAMINIGMVLAFLPVIGIPLPLVSYGGSALLPSLVALGLLIGFARREPAAARALAARRTSRSSGRSSR